MQLQARSTLTAARAACVHLQMRAVSAQAGRVVGSSAQTHLI